MDKYESSFARVDYDGYDTDGHYRRTGDMTKYNLSNLTSTAFHFRDTDISFHTPISADDNPFKVASFVCSLAMIAVACLGSGANFMTAYIFSRPSVSSSISILLAGLAVVDALLLTTASPIFAANALFTYWQGFALLNFVSYSTVYLYPLASIFQTASVWILTLITVERFVAVRRPFAARTRCTARRTWSALASVLISSAAYNFVRFWDYSVYRITFIDSNSDTNHSYSISVCIAWPTLRNNEEYVRIYVHWLYFAFVFALPFSVLLIFNGLVAYTIRQARRQRLILSRHQSKEHATAAMMMVVVLIFLLCNSLAFVLNAMEVFGVSGADSADDTAVSNSLPLPGGGSKPRHSHLFYFLVDANNLCIMLHCSVNFFIYYHFNQKFRLYVINRLERLRAWCGWCPVFCDRDEIMESSQREEALELEEMPQLRRNPSSRTVVSYLRQQSTREHLVADKRNSSNRTSIHKNGRPPVERCLSAGDTENRGAARCKRV